MDPVPEGLALPPEEALAEAQRLLDSGRPFAAHEVLEGTWKAAPAGERPLWQGLAQLAVGLTHLQRGNPGGAASLLARAAGRLTPYSGTTPYGIDVSGLCAWAEAGAREITTRSGVDGVAAPRLRRPG